MQDEGTLTMAEVDRAAVVLAVVEKRLTQAGAAARLGLAKAGRGRRPYALSAMLRVHCVQLFYNQSDPGMEDMLYEVEPVRRFAGLKLEALPDETTILKFRHLLERHGLGEKLLETINGCLSARGLALREGTVVDASIVAAPSSTKGRPNSGRKMEVSPCRWRFDGVSDL